MAVNKQYNADKKELTIYVDGRFDFHIQREFREVYERSPEQVSHYQLDMSAVDYIDSSALGMLLILKEYADNNHCTITIRNAKPPVKEILSLANFEKIFKME